MNRQLKNSHACPGGCGAVAVPDRMVACRPCWFRLPPEIRLDVWRAFRQHGTGSPGHHRALSAAYAWWTANPGPDVAQS